MDSTQSWRTPDEYSWKSHESHSPSVPSWASRRRGWTLFSCWSCSRSWGGERITEKCIIVARWWWRISAFIQFQIQLTFYNSPLHRGVLGAEKYRGKKSARINEKWNEEKCWFHRLWQVCRTPTMTTVVDTRQTRKENQKDFLKCRAKRGRVPYWEGSWPDVEWLVAVKRICVLLLQFHSLQRHWHGRHLRQWVVMGSRLGHDEFYCNPLSVLPRKRSRSSGFLFCVLQRSSMMSRAEWILYWISISLSTSVIM